MVHIRYLYDRICDIHQHDTVSTVPQVNKKSAAFKDEDPFTARAPGWLQIAPNCPSSNRSSDDKSLDLGCYLFFQSNSKTKLSSYRMLQVISPLNLFMQYYILVYMYCVFMHYIIMYLHTYITHHYMTLCLVTLHDSTVLLHISSHVLLELSWHPEIYIYIYVCVWLVPPINDCKSQCLITNEPSTNINQPSLINNLHTFVVKSPFFLALFTFNRFHRWIGVMENLQEISWNFPWNMRFLDTFPCRPLNSIAQ